MNAIEFLLKTQLVMWSAIRHLVLATLEQCPEKDCERCTELLKSVQLMDSLKAKFENTYDMIQRKDALAEPDRTRIDGLLQALSDRYDEDGRSREEDELEWSFIESEIIAAERHQRGD